MTTRSTFGATLTDDSSRFHRFEADERPDEAFALGSTTIVRHHVTGAEVQDGGQPATTAAWPNHGDSKVVTPVTFPPSQTMPLPKCLPT